MPKKIPRVLSTSAQAFDIDGLSWLVSRLPASRSPAVLERLLTDGGEVVVEFICSPSKDLSPEVEALIRVGLKRWLPKAEALSIAAIKSVFLTSALARVGKMDMLFYVKELLVGNLEVNGVAIDSMEELDATGIGPVDLVELVWRALVVNFRPTSAVRAMFDGSAGAAADPKKSPIRGKSSLIEDRPPDGPTDPTPEA